MNNAEFEVRLNRLERRVNRYRLTSVLLGLSLIGLAGIAANAPNAPASQEVRTHKLVIVDDKGRETVHITSSLHGGLLSLLNQEGIPVFRAGAGEKGSKMTMGDVKGDMQVELTSEEAGGEMLLSDKKGQKNLMKASTAPRPTK